MKKRLILLTYLPVAAASLALGLWGGVQLTDLAALPLEPIARLLRAMSLSGGAGNVLAWALYLLCSLWPLGWMALRVRRHRAEAEDGLLPLLAGLLLAALYLMINPGRLPILFGPAAVQGKPLLGAAVWAVLCCYGTLRLLRAATRREAEGLAGWMPGLRWVLTAAMLIVGCGLHIPDWWRAVEANGSYTPLSLTAVLIPDLCTMMTLRALCDLLEALGGGWYAARTLEAAGRLTRVCGRSIAVTAVTQLCVTLTQVLCVSVLRQAEVRLSLPLLQLGFLLVTLLFSRQLARGRKLQQDNDLFI